MWWPKAYASSYITRETITVEPLYFDPARQTENLTIFRDSGAFQLNGTACGAGLNSDSVSDSTFAGSTERGGCLKHIRYCRASSAPFWASFDCDHGSPDCGPC